MKNKLLSALEKQFILYLKAAKLPEYKMEYKFHPKRKWRFDFAWPDKKIAVELEGGIWTGGRHTRSYGFISDCEKYNNAMLLGWVVLRYPSNKLDQAIKDLKEIL